MGRSWVIATTVGICAACTETAPVTEPVVAVEPEVTQTARFTIVDYAHLPAVQVESLGARAERDFDRVVDLLPGFPPPDLPVELRIQAGTGIPFVTLGANRMTQWEDLPRPEYFTHQLTHLFTRYQETNFIEEGLAVWVTEQLLLPGEAPDPIRGQSAHAWASLFEQNGSAISLFTALRATNLGHDYTGSSTDASAWQLFLQAGSFTRWLIDEYGYDRWLVFYDTGILANAVGLDTPTLEAAWVNYVTTNYPDPLPCESAIGAVGERESFWCARAEGR